MINKIRKIIRNDTLKIEIYSDNTIAFLVYDIEIPIIYKDEFVYVDCELYDSKLSEDMLRGILQIIRVIKENKEILKSYLN